MPNTVEYDNKLFWLVSEESAMRAKEQPNQLEMLYFERSGEIQCVTWAVQKNLYDTVKSVMRNICNPEGGESIEPS